MMMFDHKEPSLAPRSLWEGRPTRRRIPNTLLGLMLFSFTLLVSFYVVENLGLRSFVLVLGGMVGVIILGFVSMKEMSLALVFWMLIMSGFRYMGLISMPGLPDISIDRVLLVWIIVIFFLRTVMIGGKIKGPYTADLLILGHTVYILVQMQFNGSQEHFHHWVLSMLNPLFAFFYGKYTIKKDTEIRNIMVFFILLSVFYFYNSLAQHFSANKLVWPKTILDMDKGLWHRGRSRGPVLHPPMFGQLIAIIQLVYFFFLARTRHFGVKFLLMLGLGLSLLGSLYTYTRGPWLAASVGLMVMAALSTQYRKAILVLTLIAVLGGMLGVTQMANTEFLQERMENTGTIENRLGFLANTFRVIRDHPIFGIGYFRWMDYIGEYNQTTYVPFYGLIRKKMGSHVPPHDIYLGRLAEEGIVGSFFQWAFYFVILRAFIAKWRRDVWSDWFNRNTMVMLAAMMVTYLVGGMVIDYRYFDLINVIFYLVAGLIYGYDPAEAGQDQDAKGKVRIIGVVGGTQE